MMNIPEWLLITIAIMTLLIAGYYLIGDFNTEIAIVVSSFGTFGALIVMVINLFYQRKLLKIQNESLEKQNKALENQISINEEQMEEFKSIQKERQNYSKDKLYNRVYNYIGRSYNNLSDKYDQLMREKSPQQGYSDFYINPIAIYSTETIDKIIIRRKKYLNPNDIQIINHIVLECFVLQSVFPVSYAMIKKMFEEVNMLSNKLSDHIQKQTNNYKIEQTMAYKINVLFVQYYQHALCIMRDILLLTKEEMQERSLSEKTNKSQLSKGEYNDYINMMKPRFNDIKMLYDTMKDDIQEKLHEMNSGQV